MSCPFDVDDEVMYQSKRKFVRLIEHQIIGRNQKREDAYSLLLSDTLECNIADSVSSNDCQLIKPAKWRVDDEIVSIYDNAWCGIIVETIGMRAWAAEKGAEDYKIAIYPPGHPHSKRRLISRSGVVMWQEGNTSNIRRRKDCQDCRGRGEIFLFTGKVACDCAP